MLYQWLYRHLLVHTDPEKAHDGAMKAIGAFGRSPLARPCAATVGYTGGGRFAGILGRPVPGRLGLAAGQDKDAEAVLGTIALGFGFTEVGTITPLPQPGNEAPRLWRVPEESAFRNRMGFNNQGADAAAAELATLRSTKRGRSAIVGVNIGKNKWTTAEDAAADYAVCATKLARYADYLVINVSSPNTPGLRDLQAVSSLKEIARATREAALRAGERHVPVLIKIAPDLAHDDVAAVADMVGEEELDGIVASNTTIAHTYGEGGLSGAPLLDRATETVAYLRSVLAPDKIIIGVGGIFNANDAHRMVSAGADLVEVLTGFIYEGPFMPGKVNRALARTAG
ncbi:MAG: quinone-dependent dihydroorotate dehydrogenase [Ancrocorticia sp.]|uniref:quinone-dependent dihydroorotate dehydrogenase n=1 Tax=Ancrocorticia sp. TaxID=2593684 RepID=UPI003F913A19